MTLNRTTYRLLLLAMLMVLPVVTYAQDTIQSPVPKAQLRRQMTPVQFMDSLAADSLRRIEALRAEFDSLMRDTVKPSDINVAIDTIKAEQLIVTLPQNTGVAQALKDQFFIPDPHKALWLAIVFPGGGQIYNRKYWKLPIIYGGFLGCVYAMNWNSTMYRDYSQAYIDIMDSDPNTKSYENFIPRGYDVNRNMKRIQDMFRRKKNYYRRYRDLSMFIMIGVYALSVIDAYVDAEMASFDISRELSMKVRPSIIREKNETAMRTPGIGQSYGVRCSLNF